VRGETRLLARQIGEFYDPMGTSNDAMDGFRSIQHSGRFIAFRT